MSLPGMEQVLIPLLLGFAAEPSGTPEATLADRVVAVVCESIITLSELEFEKALNARDTSPIPPLAQTSGDPLQRLEDLRMLRALAGDVPLYAPNRSQLDLRLDAFRATFEGERSYLEFLNLWGVTEAELRVLMKNRMVVESYIHRNVGLSLEWETSSVGWQEAYTHAYESWISPRRSEMGIRRIPAR